MFTNSTWIKNEHKKIKNPIKYPNSEEIYQGVLLEDFDFKFQKKNYDKIKESLEQFGIFSTEIYYAMRNNKSNFVVCFNDPNLFWHKYEGECLGSGQNYIYWKSHKINTTIWIKLSQDEISQILGGADPKIICKNKILFDNLFN